ncbi:MAG TPA: tRNA glutamyl-Q(34) synthetase GluQRS [Lysobacter sp.]
MREPAKPPEPVTYRGRFAPSPTGDLHLGSLAAALGSWLFARRAGGRWLVRIEDLDPPREMPGAAQRQLDALAAFGLTPDEPVIRQSARDDAYRRALASLLDSGRAFECHCSRTDLAQAGGIHRACVASRRRADPAVRLRVADGTVVEFEDRLQGTVGQDVAAEVGDFVLRRADGYWAYQLAVVVDDGAQRITEIVRGADLLDSTPRQILLQRALGLPTPVYAHLPLVLGPDGRKLSKSEGADRIEPDTPLHALALAWRQLRQAPLRVPADAGVAQWLQRALHAFDPQPLRRADTTRTAATKDLHS